MKTIIFMLIHMKYELINRIESGYQRSFTRTKKCLWKESNYNKRDEVGNSKLMNLNFQVHRTNGLLRNVESERLHEGTRNLCEV